MSTESLERVEDGPIPEALESAAGEYVRWNKRHVEAEQARSRIDVPLYQYTGWDGLRGIVESQSVWFTDYRHLNDPSELSHGVDVAHDVMAALAQGADPRVALFFDMVRDLLVPRNFVGSLDFFTASFTAQGDDPGQWRKYGDEGKGFALGFAPKMFEVVDSAGLAPNELSFVGPVLYDREVIFVRHEAAIATAASLFLAAAEAHADLMVDKRVGLPFMRRMVNELIASPLIWNCITSKDLEWASEREVRLVLMNQTGNLAPFVKTRRRGLETVPYVAHPFRLNETGMIHEIVVGPAAATDAEERVERLLESQGLIGVTVWRSNKQI